MDDLPGRPSLEATEGAILFGWTWFLRNVGGRAPDRGSRARPGHPERELAGYLGPAAQEAEAAELTELNVVLTVAPKDV